MTPGLEFFRLRGHISSTTSESILNVILFFCTLQIMDMNGCEFAETFLVFADVLRQFSRLRDVPDFHLSRLYARSCHFCPHRPCRDPDAGMVFNFNLLSRSDEYLQLHASLACYATTHAFRTRHVTWTLMCVNLSEIVTLNFIADPNDPFL